MVPKEWVAPPDVETAEGDLVDSYADEEGGEEDEHAHERAGMLEADRRMKEREAQHMAQKAGEASGRRHGGCTDTSADDDETFGQSLAGGARIKADNQSPPARFVSRRDSAGRELPVAERAPIPKTIRM
jgi:hypothetical protein